MKVSNEHSKTRYGDGMMPDMHNARLIASDREEGTLPHLPGSGTLMAVTSSSCCYGPRDS